MSQMHVLPCAGFSAPTEEVEQASFQRQLSLDAEVIPLIVPNISKEISETLWKTHHRVTHRQPGLKAGRLQAADVSFRSRLCLVAWVRTLVV